MLQVSLAFILLLVVAGLLRQRARGGHAVERDPGLSVLLISVDTLRADALGAYGRAGAATPWADRLAREGVRFAAARAHNVMTLPSHANMLSGRLPLRHGIRDNTGFRFPADAPTLATILKQRGFATGAFVSAFPLDSRFGLGAGFDVYDDRLGGAETHSMITIAERGGPETVAAAADWLARHSGQRTFAFVHLYEPHFPYAPPEPFASRFAADPYHGEVAAADAALEPLLRPLLERGREARTLVVFTSDHGEALGDHGERTHGVFAYEATLRVPLVLHAPGVLPAGVVRGAVRHVDLLPTVLDLLGLEAPPAIDGRSLLPLVAAREEDAGPTYFEALSPSLNQGWAPLYGIADGRLKYIDLPIPELYDLGADPAETHNLAARRTLDLDRLRARLQALRKEERSLARQEEDAAAVERLRALGYVSGTPARRDAYTEADDPKRLIGLEARASDVMGRYRGGDIDGAVRLAREILSERPDMPLALLDLAYLERARGRMDAAVEAAGRALALRPASAETAALLATYLTESGRPKEALEVLEPFAADTPPDLDALTARGMALAATGRAAEALEAFGRVRAADPSNALALVNAGTVHLQAGDVAQARPLFEQALAMDPGIARAYNSLGVIAAREGRTEDAIAHWGRAVQLNPRDYQTLYNLGTTLARAGRDPEARPVLEAYLRAAPPGREAADVTRVRAWLARAPADRGRGR